MSQTSTPRRVPSFGCVKLPPPAFGPPSGPTINETFLYLRDLDDPEEVPANAQLTLAAYPGQRYDVRELAACALKSGWVHPGSNLPYSREERLAIIRVHALATPYNDGTPNLSSHEVAALRSEAADTAMGAVFRFQLLGELQANPTMSPETLMALYSDQERHAPRRLLNGLDAVFYRGWNLPLLREKIAAGRITRDQVMQTLEGLAKSCESAGI